MLNLDAPIIPRLHPASTLSVPETGEQYLVVQATHDQECNYFRISKHTYRLLELMNGTRDLTAIATEYNQRYSATLDGPQVLQILEKSKLRDWGIVDIDGSAQPVRQPKASYLWMRIKIFPANWVHRAAGLITWAFQPHFFWITLFLTNLVLLGIIFLEDLSFQDIRSYFIENSVLALYALYTVTVLFHELGHAAATRRFGARPGAIGFGFYLLSPVFYADVSDAWRLDRSKRIIVNFAGMYVQWMICAAMMLVYLIANDAFWFYGALFTFVVSLYNFNPFLKYDGYWVLSDALNVPNLRERSNIVLKGVARGLWKGSLPAIGWKETLMLLYALCSWGMMLLFLGFIVLINPSEIVRFPAKLFAFFTEIIAAGHLPDIAVLKAFMIDAIQPISFYLILILSIKKRFYHGK